MRVQGQVVAKTAFWEQLPWKLCGLSSPDHLIVTKVARDLLSLWDSTAPGCQHEQSKRFLDPTYSENGERPLREAIALLAEGDTILTLPDDLRAAISQWLGAFKLVGNSGDI